MRVLMFGWEYPPLSSGGLGTACYGLTKGLSHHNIDVTFVVPKHIENAEHVKIVSADSKKIIEIDSIITPYMTTLEYKQKKYHVKSPDSIYGKDLFQEVHNYSLKAKEIAKEEYHDVIHCHDWMTFRAGIEAKKISKKPLVVHVHATEFDRTGGNGINQHVYETEKLGMQEADAVIAVSNFTKDKIIEHYGINPDKINVVHNAVEFPETEPKKEKFGLDKVVLFLGRITLQKGPDYFLKAAKKVIDSEPNVTFVMAGSGDMEANIIEKVAEMGIAHKFLFAGFLKGSEVDRAYKMAHLYVMPSVSEPFGIVPLEAMRNNTPVLISKQSGVSEVIDHCLKVDFWDTDEMANKIISTLRYNELHHELSNNGSQEVKKFSWNIPAKKCVDIYNSVIRW
ncbi:MAG: glycosyltransferase family 4 protein [Nanoarchaeota archaeon]|nr:glycosyltransferase family 4 protein [Nanoarchaeota archaeon]